jgi:pimeloyl-ACP methyl ester carboxylesterase
MKAARALVLAAAAVLAATSCTASEPEPRDLNWFHAQELDWGDCAPFTTTPDTLSAFTGDAECARLTVPLDHDDPAGETITLGVLRRAATDKDRRVGALVVNPGGPGGSGMLAAANLTGGFRPADDFTRRFDVVGFDPRGLGASEPLVTCVTDDEFDRIRAAATPPDTAALDRLGAELAESCARHSAPGLLAHMGTRDVARDMDVLRAALGEEKLTYFGLSYGTWLGTLYAEAFPGKVRAMVLDGAMDPTEDALADATGLFNGFRGAFAAFAAWCARQATCAVGPDPRAAARRMTALLAPLATTPLPTQDRALSYSDAAVAVNAHLFSEAGWESLNDALADLMAGSGGRLLTAADHDYGRGFDGKYDNPLGGVAVLCADHAPVTDPDALAGLIQDPAAGGPARFSWLAICAHWPESNTSEPHRPDVDGLAPILVVSTTADPSTPYDNGVALADMLGGRVLTVEGTRHGAFLADVSDCVDDAGAAYLTDLTLPPEGTRCGPD